MSPPIETSHPSFDSPNPDRPQSFQFSENIGFDYSKSGNGKPDVSSRSRPRLTKTRRKTKVDGKSANIDLGSTNRFCGEIKHAGDFKGSVVHDGNGNGNPNVNQNFPAGGSVFGLSKSGFPDNGNFEFGVGEDASGRDSNVSAKDSRRFKARPNAPGLKKSDSVEFGFGWDKKSDKTGFVFGSDRKSGSVEFVFGSDAQKQDSGGKDMGKSESNDTSGDSEKVGSSSSFQFPFSCNFAFSSNGNNSNVTKESDNKPTGENKSNCNSKDIGKENGVFIFGGLEGKWGLSSNFVGSENTPGFNSIYRPSSISGGFSDKCSVFSISDEMSRLNVGNASEVDSKKETLINNFPLNSNNTAFVLGRDSPKNLSEKTHIYASSKSLGGKRLKKKTGKLKERTVIQQLFGHDGVSKESSGLQNQKSPGCGSPMDFSPYQDTNSSNAPDAEKETSEHCEKSDDGENNSDYCSPSLPARDGLTAVRCQYKKKYKLKVGSNHTSSDKVDAKQNTVPMSSDEVCEYWRKRGNQAYHDGKLSEAEELYSTGIDFSLHDSTQGFSMEPLLLCYSNRAATRMSLGRMREAIGDCTKAAGLDPSFLKVTLRAGNCYLVLGEVEDAIKCYSKCVSLETDVCLDRRITIEAADGLQKAKRVAEYMHQSSKLLQEGGSDSTRAALKNIEEALSISRFSDKLVQMKGEALCSLKMYDEVIQLCEQTLEISITNFGADVKLWRCHLQAKSHFQRGQLDLALGLIEKQEKLPIGSRSGDMTQGSTIALAATIRELLFLKKSGNEAFKSGRYTEAIENYTRAISKSVESRTFMAICFCNRAAAYQSINQIVEAIADCSLAIALNENYEKAISRRATLHEIIRDYKQAIYDLQRLVSLLEKQSQSRSHQSHSQSKSNGGSTRETRKVRRLLSSVEEKAKKEIPLNLYLILGIKASDAESEIKKAYRKSALRHHPDKVLVRSDVGDGGTLWKDLREKIHEDADRLFKIIGEAYAVLSDPSKRSKYDNEEEMRNINNDINRNSHSGCASTSYNSPYERYERWHSYERSSRQNYYYDKKTYPWG